MPSSPTASSSPPPKPPTPPRLTILTTYFNFNANPWTEQNTRYALREWRRAGAHVILVEFALSDSAQAQAPTPFVFHPDVDVGDQPERHICHTLLQQPVCDVMWYKETGFNLALPYVPEGCTLIGLFDNDVVFVPPEESITQSNKHSDQSDWWVRAIHTTFQQHPGLSLLQPFEQVALTTENVRQGILGETNDSTNDTSTDTTTPDTTTPESPNAPPTPPTSLSHDEALERCETMMRLRPSVMRDRNQGVVGCAWVVRRHVLSKVALFSHTYLGGGETLMLNLWLGMPLPQRGRPLPPFPVGSNHPLQRYLFDPNGSFAKPLQLYRKRLHNHLNLPLQCAFLPCTLLHLYHGELASKRTEHERFQLWQQRRFHTGRHVRSGNTEALAVYTQPSATDTDTATVTATNTTATTATATTAPHMPSGLVFQWTPEFRSTGINTDALATFERSHTVREKALLRMAKMHRCMEALRAHVAEVVTVEHRSGEQEAAAHRELSEMMQGCLAAFGSV